MTDPVTKVEAAVAPEAAVVRGKLEVFATKHWRWGYYSAVINVLFVVFELRGLIF